MGTWFKLLSLSLPITDIGSLYLSLKPKFETNNRFQTEVKPKPVADPGFL